MGPDDNQSQSNLNLLDKSDLSHFDAISQYTQYMENKHSNEPETRKKLVQFKDKQKQRKAARQNLML